MKPFTFFYLLYRPTFVRMDISQTEKDPGGQMTSQARTRTRQCSSSKNCSEADIRKAIPSQQAAKQRSEEHTSELQSLKRISYAVLCLKKKQKNKKQKTRITDEKHKKHI